jgi:hypothetical protein
MRVLYVTANVLGDAGANAAEIFPRLAVADARIEHVIVADFEHNKIFIKDRQKAEFLRLKAYKSPWVQAWRSARRIAKKAKDSRIDLIHVFYRQPNVPLLIFLRLWLIVLWAPARLIMDHRSVNLARGRRAVFKKLRNLVMQVFTHHLAGNPWAAETNHFVIWKPKHIIDLGYDALPEGEAAAPAKGAPCRIWFIGSLRPLNRKSEFLIEVFDKIAASGRATRPIEIHVAGPVRAAQATALRANPMVKIYGRLPRHKLYAFLRAKPGIGVAFMNDEFHSFAPSLKFVEYAIMQFGIVASDTLGLRTQAERMNLPGVVFAKEDSDEWAVKLLDAANAWAGLAPVWADAPLWSYEDIFSRQVVGLYERLV